MKRLLIVIAVLSLSLLAFDGPPVDDGVLPPGSCAALGTCAPPPCSPPDCIPTDPPPCDPAANVCTSAPEPKAERLGAAAVVKFTGYTAAARTSPLCRDGCR